MKRLRDYVNAAFAFWALVVAGSLVSAIWSQYREVWTLAESQALTSFMKDLSFRLWASGHGGVYVPVTSETPPNPWLSGNKERDVILPSGRKFTLMNPAYMLRQYYEQQEQPGHRSAHITSLQPIRPQNAADPWEREALRRFARGDSQVVEQQTDAEGRRFLRLMRPLVTEQSCLKCHAVQGYKVGDIRGGISVRQPVEPLFQAHRCTFFVLAVAHVLIWALGSLGIWGAARKLRQYLRQRDELAQSLLQAQEEALAEREHHQARKQEALIEQARRESVEVMAGGVAHDINNLLAALFGFVEVARSEAENPQMVRASCDRAQVAFDRTRILTRKLMTLARGVQLVCEPVALAESLQKSIPYILSGTRTEVRFEVEPDLPACLVDVQQITQVFDNLALNASQAMGGGGVVRIVLGQAKEKLAELQDGKHVKVSVQDHGPGIPDALRPRIFEPFYTTRSGGNGLGLAMVLAIVKAHGGSVELESQEGRGSTFHVWLPCAG